MFPLPRAGDCLDVHYIADDLEGPDHTNSFECPECRDQVRLKMFHLLRLAATQFVQVRYGHWKRRGVTGQIAVQPQGKRFAAELLTLLPVDGGPARLEQVDQLGIQF